MEIPHIPVLRFGKTYESLDTLEVKSARNGETLAKISQANTGLVRRDLRKIDKARDVLRKVPMQKMMDICKKAGDLFMTGDLPLGLEGEKQSADSYVEVLSATSGLPHTLVRKNMAKVNEVFTEMPRILKGLTRGLDLTILDSGLGEQDGVPVSYYPTTHSLGVVLPSNSPGVNSIWMPSVALKVPVVLKPGREEPWTPFRVIQAFIAAGCPAEAFGFYPTDHEGAASIMSSCGKAIIFGDEKTTAKYADNPNIQIHGPGWSKVLIGEDKIENWENYLDVLVDSVVLNGGRSCINASAIVVPSNGREIAEALAKKMAAVEPRAHDAPDAVLSAFANRQFAEFIDDAVDTDLKTPGAEDLTAKNREGGRKVELDGSVFLRPTLVHCESIDHPLANREFLFPYCSVVEVPQKEMLEKIGPSLVVTAITEDPAFIDDLLNCPLIERLNLGPLPTSKVEWDQPHEGNLFEFLYHRRSIQRAV
ncbi:MAG: aldehyde dehydrogenase [Candidatus Omnitrophica bacterium]|nr:aldehyde dehydrogenase [Candidatus Omnitrophota bacterium]